MRFYDSPSIERIGFDFYCDIANNIVKLREENGFTQKDLAVKTGIKEYRISNMENVKIRIDLDAVEELAKALIKRVIRMLSYIMGFIVAEPGCSTGECGKTIIFDVIGNT